MDGYGCISQDVWEYDIDVTMKGSFSVLARSAEEAHRMIEEMDPDELKARVVRWCDAEADVCY